MSTIRFRLASKQNFFDNWPADWPSKERFVSQHDVTADQHEKLHRLVLERAGETQIEEFLSTNKEVLALTLSLYGTGHHASWLYPKQQIRPPAAEVSGLIPDYVGAAANSDGLSWWVLELKGADKSAFRKRGKRVFLSNDANEGICQLLNYMDASSRSQAYLRDELKLTGFREPRGILLIGTDEESKDEQIRDFKGAWNRLNQRVQIRSYGALLRTVGSKIESISGANKTMEPTR